MFSSQHASPIYGHLILRILDYTSRKRVGQSQFNEMDKFATVSDRDSNGQTTTSLPAAISR
jgi:hypothetical protein